MYTNELISGLWVGDTDILNSKKKSSKGGKTSKKTTKTKK